MGIGNTSTYDTLMKNTIIEESVGISNMTRKNRHQWMSCVSADEWVFVMSGSSQNAGGFGNEKTNKGKVKRDSEV